ncbi:MAG: PASTA domain-containing protein [Bacteroidales bacterium]|nr:PASTA domain-containing protein [Bacteroidales bacterium]
MEIKNHKILLINLGCILFVFIAAFFTFTIWLDSYTSHGETVEVPNFSNLDFDAAQILAQKEDLQVKITDTLSVDEVAPGTVVDHFPTAGSKVKRGRTIYLSINSMTPVMVVMPKVTDVSLRQATQKLENAGLRVGVLEYKPDFANNYVFEQRYKSKLIEPGTKIPKGSAIDLLVAKGGEGVVIPIPSLIGLSWTAVSDSLMARGLNVNALFGPEIRTKDDSLKSYVQRQVPAYVEGGKMNAGETIDVWFGLDPIYNAITDDLNEQ